MVATRVRLQPAGVVAQEAPEPESVADSKRSIDESSWREVLGEEFARLGQRELEPAEQAVAEAAIEGADAWVSGHAPETLPILAVALGAAWARATGRGQPLLFLSTEQELLRARQVRFGARAETVLVDRATPGAQSAFLAGKTGVVLWCTLESLRDPQVKRRLAELQIGAIFVESAHAASPWAHEIRPALALVPALRSACGQPPLLAVTRGAPEHVRLDASARLGLSAPRLLRAPVAETTVFAAQALGARQRPSGELLLACIERLPRPTIVFCATPHEADAAFAELSAAQVPVHRYHGGMSVTERATEILHFTLPGRRAVMVATSAFAPASGLAGVDGGEAATPEGLGLGYCKQKARSLVHLSPPASLEQYALELSLLTAEESTESVLFFSGERLREHEALLQEQRIRPEHVELLGELLADATEPVEAPALDRLAAIGRRRMRRALSLLEDAGVLQTTRDDVPRVERLATPAALRQVADFLSAELRQLHEGDGVRLAGLRRFLEAETCRRAVFESYWSGAEGRPCGACELCHADSGARAGRASPRPSRSRPSARVSDALVGDSAPLVSAPLVSASSRADAEAARVEGGRGNSRGRGTADRAVEPSRPAVQRRPQARAWTTDAPPTEVVVEKVQRPRRTLVS
jgi:ATP-dependent DNA helicase RecQ